ncbi:hypothetical protein MJO55_16375 [Mycolicibacterium rufum]|uniref:SnoaL-like domain-containing protein n=1 Tax=Mycolicibacterium rufum TaxID=318424 RepID=A0A9X3BEV8_9MYCO|nr:hypothetical protein [Mycolicibacterium rufum]KGI68749.1 hypothetical protein EU78_16395 [Mycolicibacterium rufum]MCV7070253.1 hypothetical protein [Mycolicibacterium rufum]ULP34898.1 hypothetical protein MJO55_16375 [Mycolicibacterium rufum]
MANRIVAALVTAGSLLLAAPAAQAQPSAEPVPSDEDQIRDVLTRQTEAGAALDLAAAARLSCSPAAPAWLPRIGPDIGATLRDDPSATDLADQLSGPLADLRQALAGSTVVRLDGIDHVVVTGDTATADITVTTQSGTNPPQTQISRATLLRQDGRWCTAA